MCPPGFEPGTSSLSERVKPGTAWCGTPGRVTRTPSSNAGSSIFGVVEKDYAGGTVRVTTMERTLVDVMAIPRLVGTWDEIGPVPDLEPARRGARIARTERYAPPTLPEPLPGRRSGGPQRL